MKLLENRVAIVTGSNKGIGKQIAIMYAEQGAKVVLASKDDIPEYTLQSVADIIASRGGEAITIDFDQQYEEQIKMVVDKTIETYGRVDILVNNAQGGLHTLDTLDTMTWENALYTYKTGPLAYATFIQLCKPYMEAQKYGRVINMGSGAAHGVEPKVLSYAMAKGAVESLTKAVAFEDGQYITINTILPNAHTGESTSPDAARHYQMRVEHAKTRSACKYVGTPYEDIAPTCLFLATEGARYFQGQTISLDGGGTLW